MPKQKTRSTAKKRFSVKPGGKIKRSQQNRRHILTKKTIIKMIFIFKCVIIILN